MIDGDDANGDGGEMVDMGSIDDDDDDVDDDDA